MTGNTKVWRAPLAGLASVAMIATMGVAASTANAEGTDSELQYPDVTVTLDANQGKFDDRYVTSDSNQKAKLLDTAETKLQLTDARKTDSSRIEGADGVFEGLYGKYGTDAVVKRNGYEFTGWFTTPDAGGSAVDPTSALEDGTTLYAHWAVHNTDESEGTVDFSLTNDANGGSDIAVKSNENVDGASNVVSLTSDKKTVKVRLAKGDSVAEWQVPSEDAPTADGIVFSGYQGWESAVRGSSFKPQLSAGVKVHFDASVKLFKDGEEATPTGNVFDAPKNSSVDQYQLVKGADGAAPTVAWNWLYRVGDPSATTTGTVNHGEALTLGTDVTDIYVGGDSFQAATQYNVHVGSKYVVDKKYFAPATSTFAAAFGSEKLDELVRGNAKSFLGWYNPLDKVTVYDEKGLPAGTYANWQFFNPMNFTKYGTLWRQAEPVEYDWTTINQQGQIDLYAGWDAAAKYRAFTVKPLYDQAKSVTVKLYEDKTIGEQLKAAESQWERSGYSIEGYYTEVSAKGTAVPAKKIDESKNVTTTYPEGNVLYVNYTADSKYGKYGLLYNLRLGYWNVEKATGKRYDVDRNNNGKWEAPASGYELQLVKPEGFTDASWKDFQKTRGEVQKEIISYLKLAKDSSIQTVYNAVASRLSEEKANEFNAAFAGKLAPETDYPDVNYDDYGSHYTDIQALTTKGIVKGYADGTFGYGAKLARVDYIVWLYRAAGSPDVDASAAGFSDVNATTVPEPTFRKAIAWAKAEGITEGYKDGTFAPYATLNRQDAMAFLYRAAGSPKFQENGVNATFSDVKAGDTANHSKEVLWAASEGIAKGYYGTVTYFGGYNTLVRQDAAAFLNRTLNLGYIAK